MQVIYGKTFTIDSARKHFFFPAFFSCFFLSIICSVLYKSNYIKVQQVKESD